MRVEQIDYTVFNQGMAGLIEKCGLDSKLVVEKETGELIKTLVRISPPADPQRTRAAIEFQVDRKFGGLSENVNLEKASAQHSKKYPTIWYASTPRYLFGVGERNDQRRASVETLRSLFLATKFLGGKGQKKARVVYPFLKRGGNQKVAILQRVLTTEAQRQRLKGRLKKNIGRLKAGWIVATNAGAIRTSSNFAIPSWVSKHAAGARGRYENWLDTPGSPAFLIANNARGITGRAAAFLGQRAITIRGKAMLANARLIVAGKKNLADYARFTSPPALN